MTKTDLLKVIEGMPENMPIMMYSGCFYRQIEFARTQNLRINGKQIEAIVLHPKSHIIC